jgi:hypothetical protein
VKTRWPTDSSLGTRYLSCPRCGLSLALKSQWPAMKHCPRCVARSRTLIELSSSPVHVHAHLIESEQRESGGELKTTGEQTLIQR